MAKDAVKKGYTENKRIAHQARMACEKWRTYFKTNIDNYHFMHGFVLGRQWTEEDESQMLKTYSKNAMVANHLSAMSNGMSGEQQQNTPQLEVVPLSDCTEQEAEIRELLTKDIMFSTKAKSVCQIYATQAQVGGYSAYYLDTEYSHPKSFDLDPVYRNFKDPTRSYFDMSAEHPNKIDSIESGYISRMTRSKFRAVYGKELENKIMKTMSPTASKEEIALAIQPNHGEDVFNWADADGITINDYYKVKIKKYKIYKLSSGDVVTEDELHDLIESSKFQQNIYDAEVVDYDNSVIDDETSEPFAEEDLPEDLKDSEPDNRVTIFQNGEPVRIEDSKWEEERIVMRYKIAGDFILEQEEFPSSFSPVIFVDQNSYYDKNGKQITKSFFNDCVDTQKYINYLRTQSAYILKITRYDQYMGSKKNVQSLDSQRAWGDPTNTKGLLTYDESPNGNNPEPLIRPELSQSLFTQYELAVEDLYRTTGLYPTRMGADGNETSGVAVRERTKQGNYATQPFRTNINLAIEAGGQVLNEMIPRVYDSERVVALMKPDTGMENVTINRQADEYGMQVENDIRKGTYKVSLKPGPSYEGQKQEALYSLQDVLQADPTSFNLIADLYAENLPLMNTIEIKNRLKTRVPKEIIEAGKTGRMPYENGQDAPDPAQQEMMIQQQQMQMQQQLKEKELQLKEMEIELKKQEIAMEAQFRIQELETERMQAAGELKEQELRYMAESERTASNEQIASTDNLIKLLTHKMTTESKQNGYTKE